MFCHLITANLLAAGLIEIASFITGILTDVFAGRRLERPIKATNLLLS